MNLQNHRHQNCGAWVAKLSPLSTFLLRVQECVWLLESWSQKQTQYLPDCPKIAVTCFETLSLLSLHLKKTNQFYTIISSMPNLNGQQ